MPIEPEHRRADVYVSREVPPLADEAGDAETRDLEGAVWHPRGDDRAACLAVILGMDVDMVDTPEVYRGATQCSHAGCRR